MVAGLIFWWRLVGAGPRCRGRGVILTGVWWLLARAWQALLALFHGCGRISFLSGVCSGLLGKTLSYRPWLWCCGVLWCAVLCCAVLCCAAPCCCALCCGALCSVVPCPAVSCCGASCRGVARCAVLHPASLCYAVLCGIVGCLVAVRCKALRCVAVCCIASCCAVFHCAVVRGRPIVPPFWRGVRVALVRLSRFVVSSAS